MTSAPHALDPQNPKTHAAPVMNALNAATVPLGRTKQSGHLLAFAHPTAARCSSSTPAPSAQCSLSRAASAMKLNPLTRKSRSNGADDANKRPGIVTEKRPPRTSAVYPASQSWCCHSRRFSITWGTGSRYRRRHPWCRHLAKRDGVIDLAADMLYLAEASLLQTVRDRWRSPVEPVHHPFPQSPQAPNHPAPRCPLPRSTRAVLAFCSKRSRDFANASFLETPCCRSPRHP